MTVVETPANVGVRGEFGTNPWSETSHFTDEDADGIYEGTISKKTGQGRMAFKFANHHDCFKLQDLNNRIISFEYHPEAIVYEAKFNEPDARVKTTKFDDEE